MEQNQSPHRPPGNSRITLLKPGGVEQPQLSGSSGYALSEKRPVDPDLIRKNRGVCINPDTPEMEYYKILRARIRHLAKERDIRTIMVTSPGRNEGKTVTTINLGLVFARAYHQTVLLVDCDFRQQDIHQYLGIRQEKSLVDYFYDDLPLHRLITRPGIDHFTLISGSHTVPTSSELLSSAMMRDLVSEMAARYEDRIVLFDVPPVLDRSETISLAPMMDGILMVIEAGVTPKTNIQKALSLLPREKFLGFVLNKQA